MLLSPKGTRCLLSHAKLKTTLSRDWVACVLVWVWSFVCTGFPLSHSFLHTAKAPSFWTTAGVCTQLCTHAKSFHPLLLLAMCPPSLLPVRQGLSLCILATSLKFRDWIEVEGPHQRTVEFESWESHLVLQRAQGPSTRIVCCPTLSWAELPPWVKIRPWGFRLLTLWVRLSILCPSHCLYSFLFLFWGLATIYDFLLTKEMSTLPKVTNVFLRMPSECFVPCK